MTNIKNTKTPRTTNTHVVKTIINNSNIICASQAAKNIGILKKDIKKVKSENLLNSLALIKENGELTETETHNSKKYVYFTIPVNKIKQDLYRMLFNPNIKDGSLNQKTRAKITPIFEDALHQLGIKSIMVHPYILKSYKLNSIFKAEINSPAFKLIIENERMKKSVGQTAFYSEIAGNVFPNTYSKNDEHPRVYNMFTQMSSSIRQHVFKNIYGVNMVEIDLTNSIVQCLASRGKCTRILKAISTNTLLPLDQNLRDDTKLNLLTWIFTMISPKNNLKGIKTQRKINLQKFLSVSYSDEVDSFIQTIENLDSPHTLFHYEDILREFCAKNKVCVNVHDAVYIPADRIDLIVSLKKILDDTNYYYKLKEF